MTNLVLRDNLFQDLFDFRRDFDQILNGMVMEWPFREERINGTSAAFAPPSSPILTRTGRNTTAVFHFLGSTPRKFRSTRRETC